MGDEVLALVGNGPAQAAAVAARLSPSQGFGIGLIVVALLVLAAIALFDLIELVEGPHP